MATDMGRGILAPNATDNISSTGVEEMRTLAATAAIAIANTHGSMKDTISDLQAAMTAEIAKRVTTDYALNTFLPRDEAERYGIEGPRGPRGHTMQITDIVTDQVSAGTPANAELVKTGEAEYRLELSIPRGLDGDPNAVAEFGQALAAELSTLETAGRTALTGAVSDLVEDSDSPVGAYLRTIFPLSDAVDNRFNAYGKTPYDYGAQGDGIHDDTAALQAWADAGGGFFPYGRYLLTSTITVNRDHFTMKGYGRPEILFGHDDLVAIRINGNYAHVSGIRFNGMGQGYRAVYMVGHHLELYDNWAHDFEHPIQAIVFDIRGVGGFMIKRNHIANVYTPAEGATGTGVGATRAIALQNPNLSDMQYPSVISDNYFERIHGLEGEPITVVTQMRDDGARYDSWVSVENNVFNSASRRFVKVQASEVSVTHNTMFDTIKATDHREPLGAINFYDCKNGVASYNTLYLAALGSAITFSGSTGRQTGCAIVGNTLEVGDTNLAIRVASYDDVNITGNTFRLTKRGMAVSLSLVNDGVIANNTATGTVNPGNTDHTFESSGGSNNIAMIGNTDIVKNRSGERFHNPAGGNSVTQGNVSI